MINLEGLLHKNFGYDSFRLGQKEIITDVLAKKDVLATLPTGSGKSICYQLPALIGEGTVIVVTPLLSLMEDQVKQLRKKGFKRAIAINSFNTIQQRRSILNQLAKFKLIYLSPEMLQNKSVLTKLKDLTLSLFVVDEAHCISQWGHEFRPDYLKLNQSIIELGQPPILALTATATPDVQYDIINHFNETTFEKHLYPIDRDNIGLIVEQVSDREEKDNYLIQLFKNNAVSSIIYFSSKKEAERVALLLSETFNHLSVAYYHSDVDKNERLLIQEQFIENQIDIICSTSAFGMGIDKQDIRLIVHYHLPTQLASFIQEIGRAGRDQQSSVSITLVAPNDQNLPLFLINSELPSEQMVESLFAYLNHVNNSQERLDIDYVLNQNHWQINEVQSRYLIDYFEQAGLLTNDREIRLADVPKKLKQELISKINERDRYKKDQFYELIDWLINPDCRRIGLYKSYQSTIGKAKYHCCDHCGFNLSDWSPEQLDRQINLKVWSDQLRSIILPFELRRDQ